MDTYLVIDTGSSSMKAFLFSGDGKILLRHQSHYTMTTSDGTDATMDPSIFRNALYGLVRQIFKEIPSGCRVCSISFTSQRSSLLPLDENGIPLSPIYMWYDKRSSQICDHVTKQFGETIYKISGMRLSPLCTAPKILWLKQNKPSIYHTAYKLVGIHDYLLFLTTGIFATDTSLASRTALLDVSKGVWSEELLSLYEIEKNKLCSLHTPGTITGATTSAFSSITGCPEGIPVISAGGDQQCCILGQGITSPGKAMINCGTGSFISTITAVPAFHPNFGLSLNAAVTPETWVLEASVLGSGSVYEWLNRTFYPNGSPSSAANEDISSISPGADGLICIPSLVGEGTPTWNPYTRGSFFNIGVHHTKAHMARALLEGISAGICQAYKVLLLETPDIHTIQISGGLTNFPLFNQMIADMLNLPVLITESPEATALGALVISQVSLGMIHSCGEFFQENPVLSSHTYTPDPEKHIIYEAQSHIREYIANSIDYRKISFKEVI